jgi:hypothetical protein
VRGRRVAREAVVQAVAVHVAFKSKVHLKPGFQFMGSRVETRRFQAMGQTGFNVYTAPTRLVTFCVTLLNTFEVCALS